MVIIIFSLVTPFNYRAIILVVTLSFFVTSGLVGHLLAKSVTLDFGIVEFGVRIGDFLLEDEQFESLGQTWRGSMPFSKRRHD